MCIGCRSCEIACSKAHSGEGTGSFSANSDTSPRIKVQSGVVDRERHSGDCDSFEARQKAHVGVRYVVLCQHCEEPECVNACIAGALTKDADGVVRHHPELCVGCWMCLMACPFEAIYREPLGKHIVKCDLCEGREGPACVSACLVRVLYLEDAEIGGGE